MRRILLLFIIVVGSLDIFAQDVRITLTVENQTLKNVIVALEQQTEFTFLYSSTHIDMQQKISFVAKDEPLKSVLDNICKQARLDYSIENKQILFVNKTKSDKSKTDEAFDLQGSIFEPDGSPLIGAYIKVKGTNKTAVSDINGHYSIKGISPGQVLVISYLGKETIEKTIISGQNVVNMTLYDKENLLDDVVVTGYQVISKERATGAYSILSSKDFANNTKTDITSIMEGMVPGLNNDGEGFNPSTIIRGVSSIEVGNQPLYIVDGFPFEGYDDGRNVNILSVINPSDIANITVLKDAAAASIYGARAANGVIVITTKNGKRGKVKVNYNSSLQIKEASSLKHLNLMNSSELVDYFHTVYNTVDPVSGFPWKYNYLDVNPDAYMDPIYKSLVDNEFGIIDDTELSKRLDYYRSLDNRKQIYDSFSRTAMTHQHNVSVSGGSDIHRFYLSFNYLGNYDNNKYQSYEKYGFNTKNDFNISSKLKAFVNLSVDYTTNKEQNYSGSSYLDMLTDYPSYHMLKDENGDLRSWNMSKTEERQKELIALGLKDESYYPTLDAKNSIHKVRTNYVRVQGGITWNIFDGLTANGLFQMETSSTKNDKHYQPNSYYMRSNINNAAQIDKKTGVITFNIPDGGRLDAKRGDMKSYLARLQFDYSKSFYDDLHSITALAGAERRRIHGTSVSNVYLGYKTNGMSHIVYDPDKLTDLKGTEALGGSYKNLGIKNAIGVTDSEDRYVSFYANALYSFDNRYNISGSFRVDESNLLDRKSNNKYRPVWSIGAGWHISSEPFMQNVSWIDMLSLRLTYGLGGNTARISPHTMVFSLGKDSKTGEEAFNIRYPANPDIRWEKTATTNVGLDFAILNSRLRGSIDVYKRHTTDLLGEKFSDITNGPDLIYKNYGKMDNSGVEFSLNTVNIKSKDFEWNTTLTFSYNKNKLLEFEGTEQITEMYLMPGVLAIGKPIHSMYSTRFAQLDENGDALFYNRDNELTVFSDLEIDDLVYSGTTTPKYTTALFNSLSYKDFTFSFKLVHYGGHVLRDQSVQALHGFEDSNFNRKSLNFWKEPGDENDLTKSPRISLENFMPLGWNSREQNVKKANFIKLRSISLSYRLPKPLLRRIGIEQVVLTSQIDDLAWWSANGDIDPEYYHLVSGYYIPSPRPKPTISFGLNLSF